jgi:hypothetical protein
MKLSYVAGTLVVMAATTALANDPANPTTSADPTATFQSLDTDGNGRISATEARAHHELNAGYENAVSDPNQGMSMEEFEAWTASQKPGAMAPNSSSPEPIEPPPSN